MTIPILCVTIHKPFFDRLFLYGSCLAARGRKLVGGMCSMLPYGTVFAVMHLYNILEVFIASVHSFFILFLNLVLINRRNGPRYQRVLALRAFSTGVIPKELILKENLVHGVCV